MGTKVRALVHGRIVEGAVISDADAPKIHNRPGDVEIAYQGHHYRDRTTTAWVPAGDCEVIS